MNPSCDPGRPWPLGATLRDGGLNFAVWSSVAESVELCLFDAAGQHETARVVLPGRTDDVWHGFVPGVAPGTRYGIRVHGPYDTAAGQRCNPARLLLDPYARAIDRPLRGEAIQFGYVVGGEEEDAAIDASDSADSTAAAPKSIVTRTEFDWGGDHPPSVAWEDTVFYEVNVRGFTQQMPEVPERLRGTFAGMANPPAIAHLKRLGVTAVQLLPIQAFSDDGHLAEKGLANYWGYSTTGFFAPEPRYCASGPDGSNAGVDEFRGMVKALHAAGIEVILDVVYNHTSEGNHLGPTQSFKGIDNQGYYRTTEDPRFYMDFTGTGNTLDVSNPPVLRMVMDSLRYWVEEMHVDGFRFDLAPAISRDAAGAFDHRAPFLAAVAQDPVLRRVKMIAEPWDLGDYGYQVGGFPPGWSEWNGGYRDAVRDFWRGEDGSLPVFAARLCGSHDLFGPSRRLPSASVNIVTVHDGFTLNDLVSYNEKHNEANGEESRDGENHNRSWNCGAEGPTDDAGVLALRERQKRNILTTLFVSRGVPLLLGGDEMGRTQQGNNNAYCQDNALSWFDWSEARKTDPLNDFVASLIALRRELPVLHHNQWPAGDAEHPAIAWFSVWGIAMTQEEWDDPAVRCISVVFDGAGCGDVPGPSVLLMFNSSPEAATFTLPAGPQYGAPWRVRVDTGSDIHQGGSGAGGAEWNSGDEVELPSHALLLLTQAPAR